jgi:amidase
MLPRQVNCSLVLSNPWLLTNSGYPVATVPIGQLRYNNRPFGLCLLAKANEEETLLRFMNAYERICKPRPVPNI